MPLYLYDCEKCHKSHEVIQKFSDPPLKKCPSCGGKLKKRITSTAFQLKGGGWYKDGYSSPKPVAEKKSDEKPKETKKEEKKT